MEAIKKINKAVFKLKVSGPITGNTTEFVRKELRKFRIYSPEALAVVVNSMGGSACQSNIIRQEILSFASEKRVKIFTFAEDLAVSGGYLILSAGSEVFCSQTSLVGGLGSTINFFELKNLVESFGIKRRQWSSSEKDINVRLDPLKPLTEETKTWAKSLLELSTKNLQKIIEDARGEKIQKEKAFNGDFFSGNLAKEYGLVDSIGFCNSVMESMFPNTKIINLSPSWRFPPHSY